MDVYLDTSVIVALTDRVRDFLQAHRPALGVSDYGGAELASVVARRVRAPDAVHLATAVCLGLSLASFDARMLSSAVTLGIAVAPV